MHIKRLTNIREIFLSPKLSALRSSRITLSLLIKINTYLYTDTYYNFYLLSQVEILKHMNHNPIFDSHT